MAEMTYEEVLAGLPAEARTQFERIEAYREAERVHDAWRAALGDTASMTIEEWVEAFDDLPSLTISQVIMSRRAAALAETVRAPLGKRLSIRARRRWQGRARAWLRRMS